jgi:DNA-binding response OmpR family regulator
MTTSSGHASWISNPAGVSALVIAHASALSHRVALVLRRAGVDVTEVSTGADALAMAANRSFDVVVLDLQLPEGGTKTCDALASFVPKDRFILLTRRSRNRRDRAFLMRFAGRVLVKPFCNENLREAGIRIGYRLSLVSRVAASAS